MSLALGRLQGKVTKDDGTGAVSGASITIRKRGAQVKTGTSSNPIAIDHLGGIDTSDNVIILESDGTIGTTSFAVDSVAETNETSGFTINISGAAFTVTAGDRLIPTTQLPTLNTDSRGNDTEANPISTATDGTFNTWLLPGHYDLLVSDSTITDKILIDVGVLPDISGPGVTTIDLTDTRYGIAADGATDDGPAVQEALDDASIITSAASTAPSGSVVDAGAVVLAPKGVLVTNQQINIPDNVILRGQGARSTIFKTGDSFPTSTPVIRVGDTSAAAHSARFEHAGVDCSNLSGAVITGSIGISCPNIQESSGASHFLVTNAVATGLSTTSSAQNFVLGPGEIFTRGATAVGVDINGSSSNNLLNNITVVHAVESSGACFRIRGASNCELIACHGENQSGAQDPKRGVSFETGTGYVRGFTGHSTLTDAIFFDSPGVQIVDLNQASSGVAISDQATGGAGDITTANSGGYYFHTNDGPVGTKTILSSLDNVASRENSNIEFDGTAQFDAAVTLNGKMTVTNFIAEAFEVIAPGTTITVTQNKIELTTGSAFTTTTISPAPSTVEGVEILIWNNSGNTQIFDELDNILIGGAATNTVTDGDMVRFVSDGTKWRQSSNRQDH